MSSTNIPKVIPAQSFLAVYNPALGTSDETFHKQIVFYYSKAAKARSRLGDDDGQAQQRLREQENEKLRQVGLAQGMVGFASSFSNGEAVDSVETHKSRIVLHELEEGWWILASIDLTQLPAAISRNDSGTSVNEPAVEYSSREVSPPALLGKQLVRAHSVFQLHHGSTLDIMFARHGRDKFCSIMHRYWSRFASSWDVLLHGSPAVDMYAGMKLAAGGELGMGVGEEDWGSSERDVLEDFARRTEGLVDVMVSRFGEAMPRQHTKSSADPKSVQDVETHPWMGSAGNVNAADGVVFSGLGNISRASLRDLSHWIENIYSYGDQAYGVRDNPTSDRRPRRRRNLKRATSPLPQTTPAVEDDRSRLAASNIDSGLPLGVPPPIVKAAERSLSKASANIESGKAGTETDQEPGNILASLGDTDTWVKYMTLGYGTAWGSRKSDESRPQNDGQVADQPPSQEALRYVDPTPDVDLAEEKAKQQIRQENEGHFLIGLKGDMVELDHDDENDDGNWNNRILLRTVHVEVTLEDASSRSPSIDSEDTPVYEKELSMKRTTSDAKKSRLRPVVYIHRPFIYTFLFHHRTGSLGIASFYRDIHNFFSPLHRTLEKSTSPDKVAARLLAAANPHTTVSSNNISGPNITPIYDLVYDPRTLTIHSSIPNIPDPGALLAEGLSSTDIHGVSWSRLEALNVHSHILATLANTRRNLSEIERTCKTNRGWWVVWMRLPPSYISQSDLDKHNENDSDCTSIDFNTDELREAFLVRRAKGSTPSTSTKTSGGRFTSGMWSLGMGSGTSTSDRMGGKAAGWGPKGLSEGIGIDARRYVEELLSLNR